IELTKAGDKVAVKVDGTELNRFPISRVNAAIVDASDGDDTVKIAHNLKFDAIVRGGAGDDTLAAGGGAAVLIGGEGMDRLTGGDSRDIVIGGLGRDTLEGKNNDDILIGGKTTRDAVSQANDTALLDLLRNWNADVKFSTRVLTLGPALRSI